MDLQEVEGGGGIDRIHLAQNRNRWRAVVNAVKKLRVSQNAGNFDWLRTCQLLRKYSASEVSQSVGQVVALSFS
jgi:hypothetical protein